MTPTALLYHAAHGMLPPPMAAAICGALEGVRAGREAADAARRLECRAMASTYDHVWWWRSRLPERKGQRCRVLIRAPRMGSVLVEFEDGYLVTTSRYAVRRARSESDGEHV